MNGIRSVFFSIAIINAHPGATAKQITPIGMKKPRDNGKNASNTNIINTASAPFNNLTKPRANNNMHMNTVI
ncbi:MAG: hypothetical protein WCS17_07425 [Prevotella sp.]